MNKLNTKGPVGYGTLTACLCRAIEIEERLIDQLVNAVERDAVDEIVGMARELAKLRLATMDEGNCAA